eukprot:TRINITY_DN12146_c0_g1_i1.p1 TRINITY_DN12146_c0_g1~~TRINITY_DN12146_c0_g1_i1.p1  ORF type:complete len:534 (-),score=122.03 TRINITY_DN12146_c0_g1_i1:236-1837(-)
MSAPAPADALAEPLVESSTPQTDVDTPKERDVMGGKTIGFWGGISLLTNNVMGPAMVSFPYLYQKAGWFPATVVMIICCFASSFSSTMLCEALRRIPGNSRFDGINPKTNRRWEFCDAVEHYYGATAFTVSQIFLNLSLQSSNIAAMIVCVQTIDDLLKFVCHFSGALRYDVWPPEFITTSVESMTENLWPSPWCLSIGLIVSIIACVPLGMVNLDENMWAQWVNMIAFVVLWVMFLIQFCFIAPASSGEYYRPLDPSLTAFATSDQSTTLGVVAFSWAFIVTIPSWVNEKKKDVSVNKSIWYSCIMGLFFKIGFGMFGAWAYQLTGPNAVSSDTDCQNMLLILDQSSGRAANPVITVVASYTFMIATLIPGIPVLAIVVRYNLVSGGLCSPRWASFWAVIFPWILTAFLTNLGGFAVVLNWAALVFQGFVNFVAPPMLFVACLKRHPTDAELEADPSLVKDVEGDAVCPRKAKGDVSGENEEEDEEQEEIVIVPEVSCKFKIDPRLLGLSVSGVMFLISVVAIVLSIIDAVN